MIRGRRVSLRPVEESDYEAIRDWQNDPDVWWTQDYDKAFSLADIAEGEDRARREGHPFVIDADGHSIGRIGLHSFRRRDRICSLDVFIGDNDYRGKGYDVDAITAMLSYAFDRFDLNRVESWCLASNDRGVGACEKAGFTVEARLPERSWKNGEWHDRVVMSVQRKGLEQALEGLSGDAPS